MEHVDTIYNPLIPAYLPKDDAVTMLTVGHTLIKPKAYKSVGWLVTHGASSSVLGAVSEPAAATIGVSLTITTPDGVTLTVSPLAT